LFSSFLCRPLITIESQNGSFSFHLNFNLMSQLTITTSQLIDHSIVVNDRLAPNQLFHLSSPLANDKFAMIERDTHLVLVGVTSPDEPTIPCLLVTMDILQMKSLPIEKFLLFARIPTVHWS